MMQTLPTHRTAAYAGAWAALGGVPWDQWMIHHEGSHDVLTANLISLCFFSIFVFIPVYFFVIGKNTGVYSATQGLLGRLETHVPLARGSCGVWSYLVPGPVVHLAHLAGPGLEVGLSGFLLGAPSLELGLSGFLLGAPGSELGLSGFLLGAPSSELGLSGFLLGAPSSELGLSGFLLGAPSLELGL